MNLRSIDLNLLVFFDALIVERSITGAAHKVGISPSAMSHALQRLRETFGDELLERTGRGMVPTKRALDLWKSVSEALQQVQRAVEQQVEFDPRISEHSFTLRMSDYQMQCVVPRVCARVRAEAPNAIFFVDHLLGDRPGSDNPGDIQVRVCAGDWGPTYRHQQLWRGRFLVAMRHGHQASRQPMTLDLYLSLPHLVVSSVGQRTVDDRLARDGLSRRIAVTIPSLAGVVPILQHTDLCAALPELWLKLYSAPGTLVTAPLPLGDADFTIDLIWRAQDERDGGHRWLRQLIAEEISALVASDWVIGDTPSRLDRVPVGKSEAA
jgi:DNA-binding transcriptional LysR family regulator